MSIKPHCLLCIFEVLEKIQIISIFFCKNENEITYKKLIHFCFLSSLSASLIFTFISPSLLSTNIFLAPSLPAPWMCSSLPQGV